LNRQICASLTTNDGLAALDYRSDNPRAAHRQIEGSPMEQANGKHGWRASLLAVIVIVSAPGLRQK